MSVPARKKSRSRSRSQRMENMKKKLLEHSICNNCKKVKLPYFVCQHCGIYKKSKILNILK